MISDTAKFHGSFFILLLEAVGKPVTIEYLSDYGIGYYLLGGRIPVLLKFSRRRKGPWTFTFLKSHKKSQQNLLRVYGECFTCMICGQDGIAGLDISELKQVLDKNFVEQESIAISRHLNGMYRIKGGGGILASRISKQLIFKKLRAAIQMGK